MPRRVVEDDPGTAFARGHGKGDHEPNNAQPSPSDIPALLGQPKDEAMQRDEAQVQQAAGNVPADQLEPNGGQPELNGAPAQPAPQQNAPQQNAADIPDAQQDLTNARNVIGKDQVRNAYEILRKYKSGKQNLEDKIIRNEKWWRMRHWDLMKDENTKDDPKPASGWLFNVIISKHADYMDSYPDANILPRESGDQQEAQNLSSIIPVVLEQNGFRKVYSDEIWYKLKQGTGVYGVFWDQGKLNGLGDITIKPCDLLSLFWEPGITDIQKSENFFSVELVDNSLLRQQYPNITLSGAENIVKKYWYDDTIDTSQKSAVVDWYYKKPVDGRMTLQYVKFVGDTVIYATENDATPQGQEQIPMYERGLYDHALYPFVFDPLFPEAGTPIGFGFVDVCKNAQASIDIFNDCLERNLQYVTSPRYFVRNDGGINEEEFANPHNLFVHVDGNLGDDSFKPVQAPNYINSNYIAILNNKIDEMKETAGNRDATNGGTSAGVTAASAIAAMQESAGKTSRDQIESTYQAYSDVVDLVIELIRQFYDVPRQFRILGSDGQTQFIDYDNAGLRPQDQGTEYGVDMGYRLPVFDIKVEPEQHSAYTKMSQNNMALDFYNKGFFNPQMADQALACIEMMDFEGKNEVTQRIQSNGGMYQQMLQMQQQMLQMSEMIDKLTGGQYNMSGQMAQGINAQLDADGAAPAGGGSGFTNTDQESAVTQKAREQTAASTRPGQ